MAIETVKMKKLLDTAYFIAVLIPLILFISTLLWMLTGKSMGDLR